MPAFRTSFRAEKLAVEPGYEMVPGRAVADDGLNGQKQKIEDRERRRKRMTRPAQIVPDDRGQKEQRQPPRTVNADNSPK